jgi:hydroxymethylbilane synthase
VKVVIGTRGSKLARAQSEWVAAQLRARGLDAELRVIRTTGDVHAGPLAETGFGVFVREIEQALLRGEVSLAVHSMKDLPTGPREGLAVAAVPEREDPADALISRDGAGLDQLPAGGRVGTGSLRRSAQLRAHRPDLVFLPLRGNVDTRLRKLEGGEYDAIVLACAGLARLGMAHRITERLPSSVSLPAPGQGALALQVREDDAETRAAVAPLDHRPSRIAVMAERALLEKLAGGCMVPVGALGKMDGDRLLLDGIVIDSEGNRAFRGREAGPAAEAEAVGRTLAARLLEQGAGRVLEECRA